MGKRYGHITLEERCEIARLQAAGRSVRQIATALDRAPSTVARELKRNGAQTGAYKPVYADQQAPGPQVVRLPAGAGRSAPGPGALPSRTGLVS